MNVPFKAVFCSSLKLLLFITWFHTSGFTWNCVKGFVQTWIVDPCSGRTAHLLSCSFSGLLLKEVGKKIRPKCRSIASRNDSSSRLMRWRWFHMLQGNSDRYESMTFLFSFVICSADVMLSPCTVWFAHHEPFPWLKICPILLLISGVNFPSLPFPPCCGFPRNICQGTMGIRYWIGWDGLWTEQGVFF